MKTIKVYNDGLSTIVNKKEDLIIATLIEASDEEAEKLLANDDDNYDGRSPFYWIRLANGDLMLGVFPCGDTYEQISERLEI
jgi:hypothetical protein